MTLGGGVLSPLNLTEALHPRPFFLRLFDEFLDDRGNLQLALGVIVEFGWHRGVRVSQAASRCLCCFAHRGLGL